MHDGHVTRLLPSLMKLTRRTRGIRDHSPIRDGGAPDKSIDIGIEHGKAVVPPVRLMSAPLDSIVE